MFNIDFNKLIGWLIPSFLRKTLQVAWMQVLGSGVVKMYGEFMAKRNADLCMLAHDSRVFSITAVLNDRFDSAARRIYLTDGLTKPREYIYTPQEAKPVYLGKKYLYLPADYVDTGIDFIVWVPNAVPMVPQDLIELNALVSLYKLAGKNFKVYRK